MNAKEKVKIIRALIRLAVKRQRGAVRIELSNARTGEQFRYPLLTLLRCVVTGQPVSQRRGR